MVVLADKLNKLPIWCFNYLIKPVIKKILYAYHIFSLRFDKKNFAFLFNLRSILIFSPAQLSWDGKYFILSDRELDGFKYRIRHKQQCSFAYQSGVIWRAKTLAEAYFLDNITFNDGDIVLDCGANVGDLKIWFDLQKIDIEYIGFEPSPIEFQCLEINVFPSIVHNIGLWNKNSELDFFISSEEADSSLIKPQSYNAIIKIPVRRLQNYIISPVKLLKLEAEGAEPEVLEGLGDKLNLIEYISADVGYERGLNCESTLVPVTNYLLDRGFELLDISHRRICAIYKNKAF